ncbi:MAG: hypothetical protein KGL35_23670 [Bradyrhizobium sp.]|nr:hypothetical protein [Bradyrhizobium sp.]
MLAALDEADDGTKNNIEAVAQQLSPSVGLPASVLAVSLKRESYGILLISDDAIASQQRIADTFLGLGLLPRTITVSVSSHGVPTVGILLNLIAGLIPVPLLWLWHHHIATKTQRGAVT